MAASPQRMTIAAIVERSYLRTKNHQKMSLRTEYKKVNRITIGFNKTQFESLQKLKDYDVNLSQFIRIAIKEKIKRDWKTIKEKKERIKFPF